jgi:hypothetical protein
MRTARRFDLAGTMSVREEKKKGKERKGERGRRDWER